MESSEHVQGYIVMPYAVVPYHYVDIKYKFIQNNCNDMKNLQILGNTVMLSKQFVQHVPHDSRIS